MHRRGLVLAAAVLVTSLWSLPVQAAFHLEYAEGVQPQDGIRMQRVQGFPERYASLIKGQATVTMAPKPVAAIWDCIFREESGNRPLGCAPFCGRGQWLPSTWRAAGGTKYAALPQYATEAQEKEIAASWLAKTDWGQWPTTSRTCGAR